MRTNQNSNRTRNLRRRRLAMALVTAMAAPMVMAQSLPQGGTVVGGGNATIGPQVGNGMTITQTSKGAIINWYNFNIAAGYDVTFDQQFGASSVTLNRVVGSGYGGVAPSMIDGTLNSNGNVFIVNPAGVVFGSGAQVNVGGLVASTLDIDDGDFDAGVNSGQYRFTASASVAGAIWNNGQLTAADGGTIGLIASKINNAGTIIANRGSVVFGATSQVTLDYFGDGLTQVTVAGNGLGVGNCSVDCNGGITSSGNVFAEAGHIEIRTNTMDGAPAGNALFVEPANGGRIWIGGNVAARTSGTRKGSVIIDAGMGNIDLGGVEGRTGNVSANANNAGEDAGTIELRGNQLFTHLCFGNGTQVCVANNRLGLVNATAFGAGGSAGEILIDVNHFYHGGVLAANAAAGSGGRIDITADYAEIYNRIFAYSNDGAGGTINIDANSLLLFRGKQQWLGGPGIANWSAALLAYGTTTGGAVNIDAGSMVVTDLGDITPQFDDVVPVINVTGQLGGNGGTINVNADYANIGDTVFANASGDGQGGSIVIAADTLLLDGGLVTRGGTADGSVTTTTTGSLFTGPNAYIDAGTWLVHAPSVQIIPGSGATPGAGAVLTDDALSSTLDGGTLVQLYADASMASGATGRIQIGDGVNIVHSTTAAASLDLRASAGIYGSGFNIASTGGPLDLRFAANVQDANPTEGYVSFTNATLDSNGGEITMSGDGSGVNLVGSDLSSGVGDMAITGTATANGATGVSVTDSTLTSTSGRIAITGDAASGEGVFFASSGGSGNGVTTSSGAISITSTGLSGLHVADVAFNTDSGDITLDGTALGDDAGVYIGAGGISTNGSDITIIGHGTSQAGVWINDGNITSHGGDIKIDGQSDSDRGVLITQTSNIVGAGGNIHIAGLGGGGAGLEISADSSINAGNGLVDVSAGNDGSSDAIVLRGSVSSTTGVNLRPIKDADIILVGAGNGFSLTNAELAKIASPLLVIGSAQHAGAIRVLEAISRDGDLTLQNQGGTGGIDIAATVHVGEIDCCKHTLVLASGGDITQTASGGITAHSLLAIAGGDVALTAGENNVAANSLAGTAVGDFTYQDVDDLAIGEVSSFGYSALGNTGLASLSAPGIDAEGDVLVRTATGDLTLGANVTGDNIDLVAANLFRNPGGASLIAANRWRVYARTWEGEERGGLVGDGLFDVYGCRFGENCVGLTQGNQFVYQERRLLQAPAAPQTVAELFDADGTATDLLQAAICPVADAGDLLTQNSSNDELGREWLKSRHRLRLSNCIDSKNTPGCKF